VAAPTEHPNAPPPPANANGTRPSKKKAERSLPHSAELEASILGGLLINPDALPLLANLEIGDFFLPQHRVVFEAIRNLQASKTPIDIVTVESEIGKRGRLDAVGGMAFLGELVTKVPTVDNVVAYTKIVRDQAMLRRLALSASNIVDRAHDWEYEADELLAQGVSDLQRIEREYRESDADNVPLISIGGALEQLHLLASKPVYQTPFPELNAAIGFGGMIATQGYVVVSGTGGGKTSFVAEVAKFTAANGVDALIASYEMFPAYYVAKMAAGELGVHSNDILREKVRASEVMGSIPRRIHFLNRPSLPMLRKAIEKIKRSGRPAPLVIVDYLQALAERVAGEMERPDPKLANAYVSRELLAIAEECEVPLLAVSATSRSTSDKLAADVRSQPPRALVGAAKETSQIEYDSAAIIVLSQSDEIDLDGTISTISVAKARFGETCHIDARFDGQKGRWIELKRVAFVPKSQQQKTSPKADETASKVRDAITRVLKLQGPQNSKTKIWKGTGRSKESVMSEIDAMLDSRRPDLPRRREDRPRQRVAGRRPDRRRTRRTGSARRADPRSDGVDPMKGQISFGFAANREEFRGSEPVPEPPEPVGTIEAGLSRHTSCRDRFRTGSGTARTGSGVQKTPPNSLMIQGGPTSLLSKERREVPEPIETDIPSRRGGVDPNGSPPPSALRECRDAVPATELGKPVSEIQNRSGTAETQGSESGTDQASSKAPKLRPYQIESIAAVDREHETKKATLLVLPTGCGKTVVFAELVRRRLANLTKRRCLILAHRGELLDQAAKKLLDLGVYSSLDQADSRASLQADVVVASVQTLRGVRLERYPVDHFTDIVVDEAHHAAAKSYRNIFARFPNAKLLGVTATPDRAIRRA
jgi:replicative DNA helicase